MYELTVTCHRTNFIPATYLARDLIDAIAIVLRFQKESGMSVSNMDVCHGEVRANRVPVARVTFDGQLLSSDRQTILLRAPQFASLQKEVESSS